MLTSYVLMWETYDGDRRWEAVQENQLLGFVEKIANEGAIPASIMVGHNPILFRFLCSDLHKIADVFFGRINEEIYGSDPAVEIKREPIKVRETKEVSETKPIRTKYGWISPDGRYFHCEYSEHRDLARRIVGELQDVLDPERYLEDLGWAKVFTELGTRTDYIIGMGVGKKLTNNQLRAIDRERLGDLRGIEWYL